MLTGHNYIVFLSGKYRGCDFPGHVLPPRNHHKPVCWYSMRRSWIPASLSCVPDVHNTSGYLFFSTGAVSVFSFPISSPASPDTRTRSHLHGFLPHILRSIWFALYRNRKGYRTCCSTCRYCNISIKFYSVLCLARDRKSTRLNSSHPSRSRMPSSA